jgi:hypothetical protein
LLVTVCVPCRFLFKILTEGLGQVDTCLVRNANQNEQNVRQLDFQLLGRRRFPFGFLETLIAVRPGHDPGQLANLFHQLSHIGQFGKIPDANRFDPVVDRFLGLANCEFVHFLCCWLRQQELDPILSGMGPGTRQKIGISEPAARALPLTIQTTIGIHLREIGSKLRGL